MDARARRIGWAFSWVITGVFFLALLEACSASVQAGAGVREASSNEPANGSPPGASNKNGDTPETEQEDLAREKSCPVDIDDAFIIWPISKTRSTTHWHHVTDCRYYPWQLTLHGSFPEIHIFRYHPSHPTQIYSHIHRGPEKLSPLSWHNWRN